jgi:hypothetical protein
MGHVVPQKTTSKVQLAHGQWSPFGIDDKLAGMECQGCSGSRLGNKMWQRKSVVPPSQLSHNPRLLGELYLREFSEGRIWGLVWDELA